MWPQLLQSWMNGDEGDKSKSIKDLTHLNGRLPTRFSEEPKKI